MNRPMSEPENQAHLIAKGLDTEFGQKLLEWLSLLYNALHQEAEGDLSAEQKAFKIERAAGVKTVIDHLMAHKQLIENGYDFDKLK